MVHIEAQSANLTAAWRQQMPMKQDKNLIPRMVVAETNAETLRYV